MMFRWKQLCLFFLALVISPALFAKTQEFYVTLKDHVFTPSELVIPANTKVKLIIVNQDETLEEFDSFDLNREKVLFPGKKGRVFVGPLPPGKYEYFGEYFPNTARGVIIVEVLDVD